MIKPVCFKYRLMSPSWMTKGGSTASSGSAGATRGSITYSTMDWSAGHQPRSHFEEGESWYELRRSQRRGLLGIKRLPLVGSTRRAQVLQLPRGRLWDRARLPRREGGRVNFFVLTLACSWGWKTSVGAPSKRNYATYHAAGHGRGLSFRGGRRAG